MKIRLLATVFIVVLLATVLLLPVPSKAIEPENAFLVGAVAGAVEAPYSFVKNVVSCSSFWDCINLPKQLGKGILNGVDRIVGTTVTPGVYHRQFGENSKVANNKILSSIVGWSATGYLLIATGAIADASNCIFSIDQSHNALTTVGAITGSGVGAIDATTDQNLYDEK